MPKKTKFKKWPCPVCKTETVVPAIVGMPSGDLGDMAEAGHVILWGCSLMGNEPDDPVQCTSCSWTGEIRNKTLFPALTRIEPDIAEKCREQIKKIFQSCYELSMFTQRPISPDGHLVGSLGEVFAASKLGLALAPPSNKGYDALDEQGRKVEIKTTTRKSISISASGTDATRLVVVVMNQNWDFEIHYDGPAKKVWKLAGPAQKNGQRRISLSKISAI